MKKYGFFLFFALVLSLSFSSCKGDGDSSSDVYVEGEQDKNSGGENNDDGIYYPVSVSFAGHGSGWVGFSPDAVTCDSDCRGNFPRGMTVEIYTSAATDAVFFGWQGDCESCGDAPVCSVAVTSPVSCTAIFTPSFLARDIFAGSNINVGGVVQLKDGGFVFWGRISNGDDDIILVKTDDAVNVQWSKVYDSGSNDSTVGVTETDRGLVVVGITDSLILIGIDENTGSVEWWRKFVAPSTIFSAWGDVRFRDGYVYVAVPYNNDVLLVKVTRDGALLWAKVVGTSAMESWARLSLSDSTIYLLSNTYAYSTTSGRDVLLAKLDMDGNLLRSVIFGEAANEMGTVMRFSHDRVYCFGYTESYESTSGYADFFVFTLTPDLSPVWLKVIGDSNRYEYVPVGDVYDGVPYIAGYLTGGKNVWVGKLSYDGLVEAQYENVYTFSMSTRQLLLGRSYGILLNSVYNSVYGFHLFKSGRDFSPYEELGPADQWGIVNAIFSFKDGSIVFDNDLTLNESTVSIRGDFVQVTVSDEEF